MKPPGKSHTTGTHLKSPKTQGGKHQKIVIQNTDEDDREAVGKLESISVDDNDHLI